MFRTAARLATGLLAATVIAVPTVGAVVAPAHAEPVTELLGDGPTPVPLKDMAMIVKTEWGLRYVAGQQDSDLVVTAGDRTVTFRDRGTASWRSMPRRCQEQRVDVGVAATCTVPLRYGDSNRMFLEIWPRLGDDTVDATAMPAMFRMWVLADAGRDVVRLGDGDDFVNGAQDDDRVWGGGGEDWLRTGIGDDEIHGEGGDDRLVGVEGDDTVVGGEGEDQVGGGPGADVLRGDAGRDAVSCGDGPDEAWTDALDRARECETTYRS